MINRENRRAVVEEVRLIIAEAIRDGDTVKTDSLAKIVAMSYPNSGFRVEQIEQHLCKAATKAGVRIGFSRPAARDHAAEDLRAAF